jgi:hypothetical protein
MEDLPITSINRTPAENVCQRYKSGKHVLVLSFSHVDLNV